LELRDLINGAQQAMEQGDYRLAIAAGKHAIVGYDACLAAHRILGESHLELGDQQAAVAHFERAAFIDPLNIVAQLGLGVAAEETKRYADAYTHYMAAWEANPALEQVREELVRVRGLLNADGRLHPSRAGLAGLHTRSGQYGRAATEWRAILAGEPENIRARTALAELLWRQGDDVGAASAARDALRGAPENARALAILADIGRRTGGQFADEFAQRFAAVDPTGDVLDYLRHLRPDAVVDSLLPDSILIDEFNFDAKRTRHTAGLGKKGITASLATSQFAAPDLWDTLVQDLGDGVPTKASPTLASAFEWVDNPASSATSGSAGAVFDDAFFAALGDDQTDAEPAEVEPVAEPAPAAEVENEQYDLAAEPELLAAEASPAFEPGAETDLDIDLVPFSLDEITGEVRPVTELSDASINASFLFEDDPEPLTSAPAPDPVAADLPVVPDPPVAAKPPVVAPSEPYVDPFVSADGRIDLTAGWDKLDQVIEASKPAASGSAGYDALVAELDVDGIVPFDAALEGPDEDAWTPFSAGEFDPPVAQQDEPAAVALPEAKLPDATGDALDLMELEAFDVTTYVEPTAPSLSAEIVQGIPLQERSGYTELLRNVDDEVRPGSDRLLEVDPFANPDATGAPLAFDELIEVTSADGTGPLPEGTADPSPLYGDDITSGADSLEDIAPFDPVADLAPMEPDALVPDAVSPFALDEADPVDPVDATIGSVSPFSFDDQAAPAEEAPVDFSDLDQPVPEVVQAPAAQADAAWTAEEAVSATVDEEPVAVNGHEAGAGHVIELEPALSEATPLAATARETVSPNGGKVHWPPFVAQTSELIDRAVEKGSLFARIAAQKETLVERGVVAGGKRLISTRPQAPQSAPAPEPVAPAAIAVAPPKPEMNQQTRDDLTTMRVRLIEEDGSAREIADALESMIAEGLQSPVALRVLGEAYLKLGLVERAAAQFRQAMLYRRRGA
jgi:tetratricopeptide (TPR) repeat protein